MIKIILRKKKNTFVAPEKGQNLYDFLNTY